MRARDAFGALVVVALSPARAQGQPTDDAPAVDDRTELAKQTQNPIADLVSVPAQFNFRSGGGLDDRSMTVVNLQPVVPLDLIEGWKVIARPIIPLLSLPDAGGRDGGIGDLQLELFFTPGGGRLVWGVGPIFSFPTATVDAVTTGSWGVGPAGVVVFTTGRWVLGALATQTWTFADYGDDRSVNLTLVQPFVNFNLGGGWAIASAPIITVDWDVEGNDWTVPVGGGLTLTTQVGGQAMNLGAHYYRNVEAQRGGPTNELRLVIAFLFPEKKKPTPGGTVAKAHPPT